MNYKKELWNKRKVLVKRYKNGRLKTWKLYKPIKKKRSITKFKEGTPRFVREQLNVKPKKLNSRYILDDVLLSRGTGIHELTANAPLYRKEGVMQVTFLFISSGGDTQEITARSNKLYLSSNKKTAFDQCYKRALGQISFSPIATKLLDVKYIYWEKRERQGKFTRRRAQGFD